MNTVHGGLEMNYFDENYIRVQYPQPNTNSDVIGLRKAQIGAIHAIASYATYENNAATIVVMPTGSGKTAVLMMAPYVLRKSKVLVVTPSAMVRGQICEDYAELKTLKKIGVFEIIVPNPVVFEAMHEYSKVGAEEYDKQLKSADVVVATHQVAVSISEADIASVFDYVMIDEAHHVPAPTWQKILRNMCHADALLVTATPFRLDRKEIKGDHVYNYPLSKAYRDGVFGEITYIPIDEAPHKDVLIAKEAERIFLNDKAQAFQHRIMVRTDTREKAKGLENVYRENTNLRLKRIDSSMSYGIVKRTIEEMRSGNIDGIICVNMLGEGFDYPNLKIAAIHEPHKSLANTLQFIGRFARTNAENIGTAKFIAMNDNTLRIENRELYSNDAVWQDIIINLSEQKIGMDLEGSEELRHYSRPDTDNEDQISLHNVRPNCHAKLYKVESFDLDGKFPDICGVENMIYRNAENNTIVGIAYKKESPLWLDGNQVSNVQVQLFIVHYQKETSLVFIYSQDKSELLYGAIIEAFADNDKKLPRSDMHRVLGELDGYEFFNTGLQNRYAESGESYRIIAGSNTAASIDETTGKMVSAGHAFCKAHRGDETITIGYSSGSKIWSSSYSHIPEYIAWCDENGIKISNSKMVVNTNTNYDLLPLPGEIMRYPANIIFCFLSEKTYLSPPIVFVNDDNDEHYLATDLDIKIVSVQNSCVQIEASLGDEVEILNCNLDGKYEEVSEVTKFLIKDGRSLVSLADYLTSHPLSFKTSDDTVIIGNELFTGDKNAIVFSKEHIIPVEWKKLGTDIKNECGKPTKKGVSIQSTIRSSLLNDPSCTHVLFDHGTGEIADFITVDEKENTVDVAFYHVKAMKGKRYNENVNDVYDVTQQAVKSTIWLKDKNVLLSKIIDRIKGNKQAVEKFVKGDLNTLKTILRGSKRMETVIYIVQPAVSKNSIIPDKSGEILAASRHYIMHSGRVKEMRVWGSI